MTGLFYGSSTSEEKFIGCSNGCGGCINSNDVGKQTLELIENIEGIN